MTHAQKKGHILMAAAAAIVGAVLTACGPAADEADGHAVECDGEACFVDRVGSCAPATWSPANQVGARVRYAVKGPNEDTRCRMSMTYTASSNADWVDKPLSFTINRGGEQPLQARLRAAVTACLSGDGGDFQCAGPLLAAVGRAVREPAADLGVTVCSENQRPEFHNGLAMLLIADAGSECAQPVSRDGFLLHDNARHVYIDTEGKIVIEEPPSSGDDEGRADE